MKRTYFPGMKNIFKPKENSEKNLFPFNFNHFPMPLECKEFDGF